jgi:2-oxo-4-hydroxy-4-carboxy-5-ureidoimidazoline decarboxylase
LRSADRAVIEKLAEGNTAYEEKFGYIFIVNATGKSAAEMLAMLEARMKNDPKDEILVAAGEQNKITTLRLKKLLA